MITNIEIFEVDVVLSFLQVQLLLVLLDRISLLLWLDLRLGLLRLDIIVVNGLKLLAI